MQLLNKIPAVQFTFDLWKAGSLTELNIKLREWNIDLTKRKILKYAVGHINREKLSVRPKKNCKAVMFFVNEKHFWTHLTNKEFERCSDLVKISLMNIKSLNS